jgi:hypothetical protein
MLVRLRRWSLLFNVSPLTGIGGWVVEVDLSRSGFALGFEVRVEFRLKVFLLAPL